MKMVDSSIDLDELDAGRTHNVFVTPQPVESREAEDGQETLPPADHGKQAWTFLLAAFVIEALLWGRLTPSHFSTSTNYNSQDFF